jgi:DNA repair protein SbcD/Mre11
MYFLVELAKRNLKVLIISGNHDSPERLAFGDRIFDNHGIFISRAYEKDIKHVVLKDDGEVNFYLLPFIKPVHVRHYYPEETIDSYTDAVRVALSNLSIDPLQCNVLLTHQFVTGASRCESEDISVGGSDNVDGNIFADFDYVALGHLHGPQSMIRETIRYCGSPLKYSFSEVSHTKSLTVIEIRNKQDINVRNIELKPLREMREIRGSYAELTSKAMSDQPNAEDYLHITLTDEEDIPDALNRLRRFYPNVMKMDYHNRRTQTAVELSGVVAVEAKRPAEIFADLYFQQNNVVMSPQQEKYIEQLIERIWEDR